jgi:hypothetical protein
MKSIVARAGDEKTLILINKNKRDSAAVIEPESGLRLGLFIGFPTGPGTLRGILEV